MFFKVVSGTYGENPDGTISCLLECPLLDCDHICTVSYSSYPSYNQTKKKVNSNPAGWKWQLSSVSNHIRKKHFKRRIEDPTSDNSNDGDQNLLPSANQTLSQGKRVTLIEQIQIAEVDQNLLPPASQTDAPVDSVTDSNEDQNLLPPLMSDEFQNFPPSRYGTRRKHPTIVEQVLLRTTRESKQTSKKRTMPLYEKVQNKKSRKE